MLWAISNKKDFYLNDVVEILNNTSRAKYFIDENFKFYNDILISELPFTESQINNLNTNFLFASQIKNISFEELQNIKGFGLHTIKNTLSVLNNLTFEEILVEETSQALILKKFILETENLINFPKNEMIKIINNNIQFFSENEILDFFGN